MFKVAQFKMGRPCPAVIEFKRVVRYWDKAGTEAKPGKKPAWTVGALLGFDSRKRLWVIDVVRGRWEAFEREEKIKATAERDVQVWEQKRLEIAIEQEPGSGGKESAQNTVRNLAGYRVRTDRPVGKKALRADPLAVQVNGGNVHLAPGDWNGAYVDEFNNFPHSTFKDQVDASSGAFAILTNRKKRRGAAW